MLIQPWVVASRGKLLASLAIRVFDMCERFWSQGVREMEPATATLVTLHRVATALTLNGGAMFLATVAQVAVVLFEVSSLTSFQREVVFQQAVMWR